MQALSDPQGIYVATVTPFTDDGSTVDDARLHALVERLVGAGVGGFVPCGSTGEFAHLTTDERKHVAESFIESVGGRKPVIVHTGALTTAEAVALSIHAERSGANAVMVVPPFYDALTWPELVAHYQAVAEATDLPIVAYNIPGPTGVDLGPARVVALAEAVPNVQFVKDSSGNAMAVTELVERHADKITVLNGGDTLTLLGFVAGTRASIWGAANVVPDLCVRLWREVVIDRQLDAAKETWARLWPLMDFFESSTYAAAIKAGCDLIDQTAGPTRRPFLPLDPAQIARLRGLLVAAGVSTR